MGAKLLACAAVFQKTHRNVCKKVSSSSSRLLSVWNLLQNPRTSSPLWKPRNQKVHARRSESGSTAAAVQENKRVCFTFAAVKERRMVYGRTCPAAAGMAFSMPAEQAKGAARTHAVAHVTETRGMPVFIHIAARCWRGGVNWCITGAASRQQPVYSITHPEQVAWVFQESTHWKCP